MQTSGWDGFSRRLIGLALAASIVSIAPAAAFAALAGPGTTPKEIMAAWNAKASSAAGLQDKAMADQIAALNIFEVLQPEWLAAKPNFAEGHARLQKAREIYNSYITAVARRRSDSIAEIRKLNLPMADRTGFEVGFINGFDRTTPQRTQARDQFFALLDEMDVILSFLADRRSSWTVNGANVMFVSQADLAAFQADMAEFKKRYGAVIAGSQAADAAKAESSEKAKKALQ
jgi:hypothetical protein